MIEIFDRLTSMALDNMSNPLVQSFTWFIYAMVFVAVMRGLLDAVLLYATIKRVFFGPKPMAKKIGPSMWRRYHGEAVGGVGWKELQ